MTNVYHQKSYELTLRRSTGCNLCEDCSWTPPRCRKGNVEQKLRNLIAELELNRERMGMGSVKKTCIRRVLSFLEDSKEEIEKIRKNSSVDAESVRKNMSKKLSQQELNEINQITKNILELSFEPTHCLDELHKQYIEINTNLQRIQAIESELKVKSFDIKNRLTTIERFCKWSHSNGAQFDGVRIQEFPHYGLGLVATRDFKSGEFFAIIPKKMMFTFENLGETTLEVLNQIPKFHTMLHAKLALALVIERLNGNISFWQPYIDMLPERYSTAVNFTPNEISELKGTAAFVMSLNQCKHIARQYAFIHKTIQNLPCEQPDSIVAILKDGFTYDLYRDSSFEKSTSESKKLSKISPKDVVAVNDDKPSSQQDSYQDYTTNESWPKTDCLHDCAQNLQENLKHDEICTGLDLAITFDQNDLKLHCLEQIGKYTETVFGTDAFLGCSKAALTSILEGDNISCDESKVFNACIEWAKSKCQEGGTNEPTVAQLKHQLADCLHFVQFRLMSPQQISDCVVGQKGLFNQEELEELFSIHSRECSLKTFKNVERQRSTINTDETMHVREATFVFTVRDFSKVKDPVISPPCSVRNLPWKIMVMQRTSNSDDENEDTTSMGFYLQCNDEKFTSWAVSTMMTRQNHIPLNETNKELTNDGNPAKPSIEEDAKVPVLIPFWDVANHANGMITSNYSPMDGQVEGATMTDVKKDEQIFMYYGNRNNANFLVHNGFIVEENQSDNVVIRLELNESDPLVKQRAELLDSIGITKYSQNLNILPAPKFVSPSLLAFGRIFNMNEDQVNYWLAPNRAASDLKYTDYAFDTELEIKTWNFLKMRLMILLKAFPTTLEEDIDLFKQHQQKGQQKLSQNKKMVIQYRITEKRILRDALAYVEERSKQ
ncbi:Actin-histidine N-methyltransferase [Pseudolycoriella hygida]|uniref:protein-histidine N-methyltransferase n=1 Tax=Pseudolycoriella hygida TaxID=35572 RepID=A0A9Q0N4Y9_9DIPT|nr:Actin-histidine N-methyltransferase [Pseudolycoriella hygida]